MSRIDMMAPRTTTPATLRTAASSLSLWGVVVGLVVSLAIASLPAGAVIRDYRGLQGLFAGLWSPCYPAEADPGETSETHGRLPERPMGADCKSVAKASKVRILHLPPPAT